MWITNFIPTQFTCCSASSSQVSMADGGMHHVADALSMTSTFTTSSFVEGHVLDGSNSMKVRFILLRVLYCSLENLLFVGYKVCVVWFIKESASIVWPSTPSLTIERLGSTGLEPSLNIGKAMDKYQVMSQKVI